MSENKEEKKVEKPKEKTDTEKLKEIENLLGGEKEKRKPLTFQYFLFGRWLLLEKRPKIEK